MHKILICTNNWAKVQISQQNNYSKQSNTVQQEDLLPQLSNYIKLNFENTNTLPEIERFLQSTRSVFFLKFFGFLVWRGFLSESQLKEW